LWLTLDGSGYKLLLSSDGATVYDPAGHAVSTFGESITLDSSRPQSIGGEDAYIVFYDSDDDGTPDTIRMGGNILMGGSQTLSEVLAELEGTIAYDHTYEFDATGEHATFTAHLFRGGVDVASQYDPGQFSWWKKTEGASGLVPLGTGYTCMVALADMGYGGHVVGRFTTTEDAELLTGGNALTDSEDEQLTARLEQGGSVRVSDLAVATSLYQTDRLLVSGVEGEHLVGMATLAAYLEGAMAGPVRTGTTAEWSADPTLVSEAGVLYVYTDHAVDSTGRPVAGVKVGDGSAYVVDLPFTDEALMEHVLDRTVHVTADERAAWNAKVRAYYAGSDQMVLTTN
ncbi:MAG: hypothetical protein IJ092_07035, partial [Atopobiaceae bacterium]|nr:hypothetical protein [Atopobiaceae bacterium]